MKTRSCKKLKKSPEGDDRISELPDDVLLHILSFIPTVDSVATCMLSTRWKHLWKHVPKLTFHDTLHRRTKSHTIRFAIFVNNVLMSHVAKVLEKLSLTCYENYFSYDVENWITKSIMRNIRSLDLTICNSNIPAVRLSSSLFTCKTLEALVLKGKNHNIIVDVPTVVCLPKLKTMELVGLEYQDDQRDRSGKLVSACSSLESLVVEDETPVNDYVGFHTISSSTLKDVEFQLCQPSLLGYNPEIFCSALRRLNLNISSCYSKTVRVPINVFTCSTLEELVLDGRFVICATRTICLPNLTFLALLRVEFEDDQIFSRLISSCTSLESLAVYKRIKADLNISSCSLKVIEVDLRCSSSERGHKLVLSAPALKSLKLRSSENVGYHIQELGSLEQADVNLGYFSSTDSSYCYSVLSSAYQLFRHVKSLKIWQGYSDVGVSGHVSLPVFSRLIELDITITCSMGYDLFQELIMNSPKIENLVLTVEALLGHYWTDLHSVPACLLSSLRSVSIRSFKGREDELAMILYILGNARIMEKMEVCFARFRDSKSLKKELCQKILKVPRGSANCKVVFIK